MAGKWEFNFSANEKKYFNKLAEKIAEGDSQVALNHEVKKVMSEAFSHTFWGGSGEEKIEIVEKFIEGLRGANLLDEDFLDSAKETYISNINYNGYPVYECIEPWLEL